jgi:F0F1-type ATP synthase assembly protein I
MRTVRNILITQAATAAGLAAIVWLALDSGRAIPTLVGGLIGVVPNAFLAARVMSPRAGASATRLLRAGWLGEIGKLVIAGFLFTGYIATLLAMPVGLLFDGKGGEAERGR